MEVQAVSFDRSLYTHEQARAWLRRKGFMPLKVHFTKDRIRYRIKQPHGTEFRTITVDDGVRLIIMS